jgi:hypothetical protein
MYILIKIICYLFLYILPRKILRKSIRLKELVIFLFLALVTIPILRQVVMDNPEFLDAMNGYMDLIIAILVIL